MKSRAQAASEEAGVKPAAVDKEAQCDHSMV